MNPILKAYIIDDEVDAVENVKILLQAYPYVEVVGFNTNSVQAVEEIQQLEPDLLFVDIQMPEIDGFDLIERVSKTANPYIIFTTAYDQFALKAFEKNAIDYLLKPYSEERFEKALNRAKEAIEKSNVQQLYLQIDSLLQLRHGTQTSFIEKVTIRQGQKLHFVSVSDVIWFEADNQYVQVHTLTKSHLIRDSLSHLEEVLDPKKFYRTHRSAIVNLDLIVEVEPYFKGDYLIKMTNGAVVKLSRTKSKGIKALLNW